MPSVSERGLYPVVSMKDGTVRNMGWLELGGWRIGIDAPGGAYFYYAHLSSYADLQEGDEVKAGDLLVEFDLDAIKAEGYDPITPVVVTNGDDYIRSVNMVKSNDRIEHGECLLTIV